MNCIGIACPRLHTLATCGMPKKGLIDHVSFMRILLLNVDKIYLLKKCFTVAAYLLFVRFIFADTVCARSRIGWNLMV